MPVAKSNGINIDYQVQGDGEPLVMIMGLGFDKSGWRSQVGFFKRHFQVITFDNRGSGKSDKPAGPYSTGMMADDTVGLMDYLHIDKANILGVSMGGMIAQELAIKHPQRVGKLILGCTFAIHDDESGETREWDKALELREQGKISPMINLLFDKPFRRIIFTPLVSILSRRMGKAGALAFSAQREACLKHQTLERLTSIKAPTLVIVGNNDRVIKPTSSEVLAKMIPGAKLAKIENGSHTFPIEMTARFNGEVLNFLKG
jgi:pimeloyl-ACP methyl ester carboxylesterase